MASPDPPFKVKALFDYTSPHEDDLNFPADVVITVSALEDDDWYFGAYVDKATGENKEGIFPKNFVERIVVEVPARPARSARKKVEPEVPASPVAEKVAPPPLSPPPIEKPDPVVSSLPTPKPVETKLPPPPTPVEVPKQVEAPRSLPPKAAAKPPPPPAQAAADKPGPSNKPPPPDKPSSSSFKDRLALFNKGGATPVTPYNPLKPRQDVVKKPFVPPPPSKNAYVPPPISHVAKPKRDEGPAPPPPTHAEPSAKACGELERDEEENVPKQSLKERIALLQTQQLDPTTLPGGKPKPRPKPKRVTSEKGEQQPEEDEIASPLSATTETGRKSYDEAQPEKPVDVEAGVALPPPRAKRSMDIKREEIADDSSVGDADVSSASVGPSEARVRRTAPAHQSDFGDDEGANDTPDVPDSDDEEEEDIDPEVRRKIALRERMMKMSGGMGMHGMFGPPLGIPTGAPAKKKKSTGGKSVTGEDEEERSPEVPRAPVPALPFAMPRVQSPPVVEHEPEEEEDQSKQAPAGHKISEELLDDEPVDVEDMRPTDKHPHGPRPMPPRSPPTLHEDVPGSPPPLPTERPVLHPPVAPEGGLNVAVSVAGLVIDGTTGRPAPPPPPVQAKAPSEGSESDDEMSATTTSKGSVKADQPRSAPPPPPVSPRPASSGTGMVPPSSPPPPRRQSQSYFGNQPMSPGGSTPLSPHASANKRASYQRAAGSIPPVPGAFTPTPAVTRPPPRPPVPERQSHDESRSDSDEEVTEYEADYDTDIANKVAHRDALTAQHGKERRESNQDDTPLPSPVVTPIQAPTRAVPPPPPVPSNPSPATRPSMEMPRAPPPPPPQASAALPESGDDDADDEPYDPYSYNSPTSPYQPHNALPPPPPPPGQYLPPPPPLPQTAPPPPPPPAPGERLPSRGGSRPSMDASRGGSGRTSFDSPRPTGSRASMDVPRSGMGGRRSMDQSRPHSDYVARDIDLGESSAWWTKQNALPPTLQTRAKDLRYEMDETPHFDSGRMVIQKEVYVLFHDYSQTVISVRYDRDDPSNATVTQRHEAPPSQPRQDQLEDFQAQYGSKIFNGVKSREGAVVGDGDPMSLIKELFTLVPEALLPVGTKGFGCLVYANLANASTQHFDEIRPGDVITFRNTRFQGHKGGLHQKYSMEVGKPEHVAVVVDWDGTKKKIRAYEQGRESRKVKLESFKIGDLRSGEVKVWRVVGRSWVGWAPQ